MAVLFPHPGVIQYAAVHATLYESFEYCWNGGTLRLVLNMDNNYPNNIQVRLMHSNPTEEEVVKVYHLGQFQKKRIELA